MSVRWSASQLDNNEIKNQISASEKSKVSTKSRLVWVSGGQTQRLLWIIRCLEGITVSGWSAGGLSTLLSLCLPLSHPQFSPWPCFLQDLLTALLPQAHVLRCSLTDLSLPYWHRETASALLPSAVGSITREQWGTERQQLKKCFNGRNIDSGYLSAPDVPEQGTVPFLWQIKLLVYTFREWYVEKTIK